MSIPHNRMVTFFGELSLQELAAGMSKLGPAAFDGNALSADPAVHCKDIAGYAICKAALAVVADLEKYHVGKEMDRTFGQNWRN